MLDERMIERARERESTRDVADKRGFTLVEIIVVLVILAILAAFTIPAMLGYISKARETKVANAASQIMLAAKAACTEQYGLNYESYVQRAQLYSLDQANTSKAGRITNNMLFKVQNNKPTTTDQAVDAAIAKKVLEYLDSSTYKTATYKFSSERSVIDGSNVTVDSYYATYKQAGVIIAYTPDGNVSFVEFGSDGYLAHLDSSGNLTVVKNGTYSKYPNK